MHAAVVGHLRCPVCSGSLILSERSLRCPLGHSFDLARQGYVELSAGPIAHAGDSPEMVAARQALLTAGHFDVIADAVASAVEGALGRTGDVEGGLWPYKSSILLLEVGAGTAHYLARALGAGPGRLGLAIDVSKAALRRAARADPRIGAVRADVWQGLPVRDGAADVVLDIFAPRSGAEFYRVLRSDGALIVVTAVPGHLGELIGTLGLIGVDPMKRERLTAGLGPWFVEESVEPVRAELRLSRADATALVGMGPSAWHVDPAQLTARLAELPEPITATLAVESTTWRRKSRLR